jgi:Cu-processing system permease protein
VNIRITLVFLILFWIQELISKEIDKKTILFTLAYPVPRSYYLLGRYVAILVLAAISSMLLASLLWLAVKYAGGHYQQQFPVNLGWNYWVTVLGIYLDAAVVAAFAIWISTLSTTPLLPMAIGFIFAISGKALGAVIAYLNSSDGKNDELAAQFSSSINQIQWLLPDLSRLDWRLSTLYSIPLPTNQIAMATLMALSYIALMLCLAILFFRKREFF